MKPRRVADKVEETRRHNLIIATSLRGSKTLLANKLHMYSSDISNLINGRRLFTDQLARDIEHALGLLPMTLDAPSPLTGLAFGTQARTAAELQARAGWAILSSSDKDDLELAGVNPLCQALVKILIRKSQEGSLSDDLTLELLNKVMPL
ncbi:MAG: hypothetical protein ACK5NY_01415 [Burkholderiaceae bacterium]